MSTKYGKQCIVYLSHYYYLAVNQIFTGAAIPGDKTVFTLHQCNHIYAYMQQHTDVAFKGCKTNCLPEQEHQQKHMHMIFSFTWAACVKEGAQFNPKF